MQSLFSDRKTISALVVPGLAIMLFAIAIPLVISLYLSFMQWSGIGRRSFIGFTNYIRLFQDRLFWQSLYNVGLLILVTIVFQNVFAFIIASLLTKLSMKASHLLRTIYFIPATLSLVVVTKLWVNVFEPEYGMLNNIIRLFGIEKIDIVWLENPKTAIWAVIWIMIWQGFGWAILFFYSGLLTVPKDLEEAAVVDGANRFQVLFHVVLPNMLPVIQSIVIIVVISSFKQMEMIWLSTKGGSDTQFLAVYLYKTAFENWEQGYGNTLSVLLVIIAVMVTALVRQIFKKSLENF